MSSHRLSVLSIEDNPDDALFIRRALGTGEESCFDVVQVGCLREGLTLLAGGIFDAVLLDLSLPDSEGLESLQRIRQRWPDLPVIIVSGQDEELLTQRAVEAGAQDYVPKAQLQGLLLARSVRFAVDRNALWRQVDRARLEELARKERFLSHVSHELRTPLAVIKQFTGLLTDGVAGPASAQQLECLQIVERNTRQLQRMIEDLLEVTRVREGKLVIQTARVRLDEVARDVVALAQATAAERDLDLQLQADSPLEVVADPARAAQILTNLLDNALKFTPAGGRIVARVGLDPEAPGHARLSVEDTGPGIPPEWREMIFDRLVQAGQPQASASSRKGLGLGLHICAELVSLHAGKLWVESDVGRGSRFHVRLPLYDSAALLAPLVEEARRLDRRPRLVRLGFLKRACGSSVPFALWRALRRGLATRIVNGRDVLVPSQPGAHCCEEPRLVTLRDDAEMDALRSELLAAIAAADVVDRDEVALTVTVDDAGVAALDPDLPSRLALSVRQAVAGVRCSP